MIVTSSLLFPSAMAKTNGSKPVTTKPAAQRNGSRKQGTAKGGPPPARRSARTNRSAAVGDSIDPSLRKPPPESILPATGAPALAWIQQCAQTNPSASPESLARALGAPDMPSLVARAKASPYPLRNNRTPVPNPPAVIYGKGCAPGDVSLLNESAPGDLSLLNFRSPTLPPIDRGLPDDVVERRELDGQALD